MVQVNRFRALLTSFTRPDLSGDQPFTKLSCGVFGHLSTYWLDKPHPLPFFEGKSSSGTLHSVHPPPQPHANQKAETMPPKLSAAERLAKMSGKQKMEPTTHDILVELESARVQLRQKQGEQDRSQHEINMLGGMLIEWKDRYSPDTHTPANHTNTRANRPPVHPLDIKHPPHTLCRNSAFNITDYDCQIQVRGWGQVRGRQGPQAEGGEGAH